MTPFRNFATFTVARDAGFVALAAVGLMFVYSYALPLALDVGATVALVFAVGLVIRTLRLTEERFLQSEAWRVTYPDERLTDEEDVREAHAELKRLLLCFAKGAAGIACFLYGSALVMAATV